MYTHAHNYCLHFQLEAELAQVRHRVKREEEATKRLQDTKERLENLQSSYEATRTATFGRAGDGIKKLKRRTGPQNADSMEL